MRTAKDVRQQLERIIGPDGSGFDGEAMLWRGWLRRVLCDCMVGQGFGGGVRRVVCDLLVAWRGFQEGFLGLDGGAVPWRECEEGGMWLAGVAVLYRGWRACLAVRRTIAGEAGVRVDACDFLGKALLRGLGCE